VPRQYKIKVLEKALSILDLFNERGKELTITQINQTLGLNKSTTFRILNILEKVGYLERDDYSLKYRLGFKLFFLGSFVEANAEMQKLVHPFLEEIAKKTDETVHLVVLQHGEALYLDKIDGKKVLVVSSRIGMKLPAHCSGVGKVLLSFLPEEALENIVEQKGLRRFTKNTITDKKALKAELNRVRKQGYAIDNEEIEIGMKCVAAPVTGVNGEVIAAISISGPKERFSGGELERFISIVKNTTTQISALFREKNLTGPFLRPC
jgi:DNA-binding IclR family transcriptional regulator